MKKLNELEENSERQFNEYRIKIDKQNECFTKETETLKKEQNINSGTKEHKWDEECIGNGVDHTEKRISTVEDRNLEMIQMVEERELSFFKNEETLSELSNSIRKGNIMSIPKGEERERESESLFKEILAENFPNLRKNLSI